MRIAACSGDLVSTLLRIVTSNQKTGCFDGPARTLGTQNWRRLHKAGLYVIGIAFVQTMLPATKEELFDPVRIGIATLTAAAVLIRLTAFFANQKKSV